MKLQGGVLHRTGRGASGLDLALALGQFNGWRAETTGEVVEGPIAMLYRGDQITVEEKSERQPVSCGQHKLTWDGRLDNRSEIASRVGLRCVPDIPDPEIVVRAYAALGEAVLGDLIGEFALVVWSKDTRELTFARSICGSRPLYYVLAQDRLIWSSDIVHLVRTSKVQLDVNDTYILEYLFAQPSTRHTPFKHVHVVPSGRMLKFKASGRVEERLLWDWSRVKPTECSTDDECEERCRALMREAVEVRLRSADGFFSEMSGGLDSSSVVVLADAILGSRGENTARLKTLSCVYEESETCDESRFIEVIEQARGMESLRVHEHEQKPTLGLRNIAFTGVPNPLHSFPGRYERFTELIREHRARLLLTGTGGDHLFWSDSDGAPIIADELRRGRLVGAHRECKRWSRMKNIPYFRLFDDKVLPLVFDALGWRPAEYWTPQIPTWLLTHHRDEVHAVIRRSVGRDLGGSLPSERAQRRSVEDLFATISAGYFNEYRELYISHPYTHRPLVEFCTSLPFSQFTRNGETRSVMRRAMRELLPTQTLKRRGKAGLEEVLVRAIQRDWGDVGDVRRWRICERGYASAPNLAESLEKLRMGLQLSEEPLLRVVTIERWLRSLECASGPGDAPGTKCEQGAKERLSPVAV